MTKLKHTDGIVEKANFNFKFGKTKVQLKFRTKNEKLVEKIFINGEKVEELSFPWQPTMASPIFDEISIEDAMEIGEETSKYFYINGEDLVLNDRGITYDRTQEVVAILDLQDALNTKTCGINWKDGRTDEGNSTDWYRYIYMELTELIESFPYKHWKDLSKPADIDNAKIEVVDVWHFLMGVLLSLKTNKVALAQKIIEIEATVDEVELMDVNNFVTVERLMSACLQNSIALKVDGEKHIDEYYITYLFMKIVVSFFEGGLKEMESLYLGKNALNKIRQDYGYKDSSYEKMWLNENGEKVEDNVVMTSLLAGIENPSFESIYNELAEYYETKAVSKTSEEGSSLSEQEDADVVKDEEDCATLESVLIIVKDHTGKKYNIGHMKNRAKKLNLNVDNLSDKDLQDILNSFL